MGIIRCPNRHYYDQTIYDSCPFCKNSGISSLSEELGIKFIENNDNDSETIAINYSDKQTNSLDNALITPIANQKDTEETVAYIDMSDYSIPPVVGWLVCYEGADKGRDFRLITGINRIGRAHIKNFEIEIRESKLIRDRCTSVMAYDEKNKRFYLSPGSESNLITYINDQPTTAQIEMKAYDSLSIGDSKFVFLPLCSERFDWINHLDLSGKLKKINNE